MVRARFASSSRLSKRADTSCWRGSWWRLAQTLSKSKSYCIRDSASAAVPRGFVLRSSFFVRCPSTPTSHPLLESRHTVRYLTNNTEATRGTIRPVEREGRAIGFRRAVPRLCSSSLVVRRPFDDERPVLVLSVYVDDFSSLLQRYDLLVSMRRCIVRRNVFVVLRGAGRAGRGLGGRESAAESAANDVHDQEQTEQRQDRDQGDRCRAPASRTVVTNGCCLVLLRGRDRTDRTAGSGLGWRRIAAGDRADGFPATEPTSGLTGTRCTRVRVPSGSFGMRVVQTIGAGSFAPTYGTAVSVRLVAVGTPFPAAHQGRTIGIRSPALAERAVVLVHEQSSLAVKVALDFRANFLAGLVDHHRVVRGLVESLRRFARANRTAFVVSREFAVRLAERNGQTRVEVGGRLFGGAVLVVLLVGDAAADGTIVFVRLVSVFAVDRATLHRQSLARGFRFDEGAVHRDRTVGTAFARLRCDRVFAGFAHRLLTGDLLLLANAAHAIGGLPSLAGLLRLLFVDTVSR